MVLGSKQERPRLFWWSYAPLIAFAVNVLWPNVGYILAVLGNEYDRFKDKEGSLILVFLLFAAANWAFIGLFFVAERKLTEATEQRLPIGSVKTAMWSSLVMMLTIPNILLALLWYLPPYGRGSDIGKGIVWLLGLFLQILALPLLGWIGWFASRGFTEFATDHKICAGPPYLICINASVFRSDVVLHMIVEACMPEARRLQQEKTHHYCFVTQPTKRSPPLQFIG